MVANHADQVQLVADGETIQYWSDGSRVFNYVDTAPYSNGWFAFRTTDSHFHRQHSSVVRPIIAP